MRIITWNINGIRTFKGRIKNALDSLDADIICVQETKVTSKYKRALPRLRAVLSHNIDISLLLLNYNFCCFPLRTGDLLEAGTAIVDGYNSYFSFSRGRSGYSGLIESGREKTT